MSNWITVCEFPLSEDLSAVAEFIHRHQLPMRISEENNCQCVASLAPQLVEPMQQLLERWRAGEVDLSQIQVHTYDADQPMPEPTPAPATDSGEGGEPGAQPDAPADAAAKPKPQQMVPPSVIPQWSLRQTPLSLILIALCFIGWFLQWSGLDSGLVISPQPPGDFNIPDSSLGQHIAASEFWRLWTPAMIHFSLPHALFNSLGIWIVGRSLEARAGTLLFTLLVLIVAPVANFLQFLWSPEIKFGGMSGVVYGMVGAVFVIQIWAPRWKDVPKSVIWLMIVWLVLCAIGVVEKIFSVGIANAAHIGGFAAGLLLALIFCAAGGARRYFSAGHGRTAEAISDSRKEF
ncbi:rhomboid family intramembrane serine protease [Microbulbifer hydrolyticus]|uniref:GlpG protein n=1 Tax=Microbulbifer hydrolyticus TaxID=48074 RepID=A0A6P1T7N3_9GAMM|nr:rhomboid family intramembrane serine protease [Microbulbifer hydrolyticus]MBB5211178.1 GlpG protein [Microbulbifer hydrolyticus]QHQ38047.1 rhomboid family intramembrane serine protease [Microbulbifer hydrolyticus]